MRLDINMAIVGGNLTAEPELKQSTSGKSVIKTAIAIHRKYNRSAGVVQTDYLNIVLWDNNAEFVAKYAHKGDALYIVGEIQTRSWTDKKGAKQYSTEIVASEVRLYSNKEIDNSDNTAFENTIIEDGILPF